MLRTHAVFYPCQSLEGCREDRVFVEAVMRLVVELGGANTLHLGLFGGLSPLDWEVGKICEAGHTLPEKFSLSHLFLVQ